MQTQNLGQLLAQTLALHASNTKEGGLARAKQEGEAAVKRYQVVEKFFEQTREKFTLNILAGLTGKDLEVVLGQRGIGDCHNMDVDTVLQTYSGSRDLDKRLANNTQYGVLWLQFKSWAASVGLTATWSYRDDGAGMHSWYVLSVAPNVQKAH